MLTLQVFKNIEQREIEGISQKETLQMLRMLAEAAKNNDWSNDSLRKAKKLWKQLVIEANA
jgi:hypothetical protein